MTKATYGIDAPSVIRNLCLAALGSLLMGYLLYSVFSYAHYAVIAIWLWRLSSLAGVVYFLTAIVMLWSSLVGKKRFIKKIVAQLHLQGQETVLDVGCGRGIFLIEIAKKLTTGKAVGIDIWQTLDQSGNALQATVNNAMYEGVASRVEVATADMRNITFAAEKFDVVVSCLAIHNLTNATDRAQALTEILRVLKPGGQLAIVDFQYIDEYYQYLAHSCDNLQSSKYQYAMFPPVRVITAVKKSC